MKALFFDSISSDIHPVTQKIVERTKIFSLVTHYETDIYRVAVLREKFGIDGQRCKSAIAYRQKDKMKSLCEINEVNIPKFQKYNVHKEVSEEIKAKFNFPLVVKPVDGLGSASTWIVESSEELLDVLNKCSEEFLVEEYIDGDLFHVDGIVSNEELIFVNASKYFGTTLNYLEDLPVGSYVLDQESEDAKRLITFATKVLKSLPNTQSYVFHCELFMKNDGEIVFGEIASRPPGALVPQVLNHVYGFNINQVHILQQVGKVYEKNEFSIKVNKVSAWLTFPPKAGRLRCLQEEIPEQYCVEEIYRNYNIGEIYSSGDSVGSYVLGVVLVSYSEAVLLNNCKLLSDWFNDNFIFENKKIK